jgi:hypothetical protein
MGSTDYDSEMHVVVMSSAALISKRGWLGTREH